MARKRATETEREGAKKRKEGGKENPEDDQTSKYLCAPATMIQKALLPALQHWG
jgi:hypothetical protein